MLFQTQEGTFDIPDGMQDRSINMLIGLSIGLGFNLVITRDKLEPGEAFDAFIDRQLQDFARQVVKCTLIERTPLILNNDKLKAIELAMEFKQNGQQAYQRQAIYLMPDKQAVVIATITSLTLLNNQQKAQWKAVYSSFNQRK